MISAKARVHTKTKGRQAKDKNNTWKCFIGGLTPFTTKTKLKKYFQKFGNLKNVYIPYDPKAKKLRGYGFVEFKEEKSYLEALSCTTHKVLNIEISVERLMSFEEASERKKHVQKRKLFVKGLPSGVQEADLDKYFSKYGEVEEVLLQHYFKNGKKYFREFGFVIMKNEKDINKILSNKKPKILNRKVEISRAIPRKDSEETESDDDSVGFKEFLNDLKKKREGKKINSKTKKKNGNISVDFFNSPQLRFNYSKKDDLMRSEMQICLLSNPTKDSKSSRNSSYDIFKGIQKINTGFFSVPQEEYLNTIPHKPGCQVLLKRARNLTRYSFRY